MNPSPPNSPELATMLAELSWRRGTFRLASGRSSDFYVDVKQTVMTAPGARLLGSLICDRLVHHGIQLVGGMAVGAVPLLTAALVEAAGRNYPLDGFFVRRQAKDHGTESLIEGRFDPALRIALVEDVVTSGGSTLTAIEEVEKAGAKVSLVVTVVDREENQGMERLGQAVATVETLSTRSLIIAAGNPRSG
ncbi:MAG: orotate phosphoribosyltransferase [Deltaproteobacteria bacterium]